MQNWHSCTWCLLYLSLCKVYKESMEDDKCFWMESQEFVEGLKMIWIFGQWYPFLTFECFMQTNLRMDPCLFLILGIRKTINCGSCHTHSKTIVITSHCHYMVSTIVLFTHSGTFWIRQIKLCMVTNIW